MIFLPSPLAAWTEFDAAAREYLGRATTVFFVTSRRVRRG